MSQLLILILTDITSIAAAFIAAILTVRREYEKDIVERYEIRADLYKREHFKRLIEIIPSNKEIYGILTNADYGEIGILSLETPGISIKDKEKRLTIEVEQHYVEDEELTSHFKSYNELDATIAEVKIKEENYKERVYKTLNSLMNELAEIESEIDGIKCEESPYSAMITVRKVSPVNIADPNSGNVSYNKHQIINCIIQGIEFSKESFVDDGTGVLSDECRFRVLSYEGNKKLEVGQLEIFLKTCQKIADMYSNELRGLEADRDEILEIYKKIYTKFIEIIHAFESGVALEGSCDVCKRIEDGKEKRKLMAFEN